MFCFAEYYITDCGKKYYYVPLKISTSVFNSISEYPLIDFLPDNLCTQTNLKGTACKKPQNVTFRKIILLLDNSQEISIEIPFKFSDLEFINFLQTCKNDNRVVSVQYFGETIRPHIVNKVCP